MAETTADVRRDIEMTRERMSDTLAQLERKMNLTQMVKDHPWPALAVAFGAGVLLSGSRADVKAAAATVAATQGASGRLAPVLDDLVANVMTGVTQAFQDRVVSLVEEIKEAIGAPSGPSGSRQFAGNAGAGGFGGSRQPSAAGSQQFGEAAASSSATSEGWAPQSASAERHTAFGGESPNAAGGNRSLGAMEGQGSGGWGTPRADRLSLAEARPRGGTTPVVPPRVAFPGSDRTRLARWPGFPSVAATPHIGVVHEPQRRFV